MKVLSCFHCLYVLQQQSILFLKARLLERGKTSGRADDNLVRSTGEWELVGAASSTFQFHDSI